MATKKTKGYDKEELKADREISKAFPPKGRVPSTTKKLTSGKKRKPKK